MPLPPTCAGRSTRFATISTAAAFPDAAMQGLGMGDLSIKKEWKALCAKYRMSRVRLWTLDVDLAGLDRAGAVRRRGT